MTVLIHQATEPYAYALTTKSARLVLLAEASQVSDVIVHYGDRYIAGLPSSKQLSLAGCSGEFDVFTVNVDVPTSRLQYAFQVREQSGEEVWFGETGQVEAPEAVSKFQLAYLCARDVYTVPDWVGNAVAYQIFPERFDNGNPLLTPSGAVAWDASPTPSSMHGGDLPGIRRRLPYLQELGVNLVYLTPIFLAGSNHKYDTWDYMKVDPQFGTEDDLRDLVRDAHARGIRIVLDAVFNHSGMGFAPFQHVITHGRNSSFYDWFFIDGDVVDTNTVNYETFAIKNAYMPKLHIANPEVEDYLLKVARYWLDEFDIDGWRLDVANEIDHVFWRRFRDTVKAVKPDALILGEVWHNPLPWLRGDEFDAVMNYRFRDACLRFVTDEASNASEFAELLTQVLYQAPEPAARAAFNLLGSHDTARILTVCRGDEAMVKLLWLVQFTYPGIPMTYYGDEIGMIGETDPDCRRGMIWDPEVQNRDLFGVIQRLTKLKAGHEALAGSGFRVIYAQGKLLVFERFASGWDKRVIVCVNAGQKAVVLADRLNAARVEEGLVTDLVSLPVLFTTASDAFVDGALAAGQGVVLETTVDIQEA